jgi:spermidine synthase
MLLGSGFCSLVYQVGWLRELRLVFGASTAASAAVLAIFIGGLGVGSLVLGRRADAARNPLMLYGNLELVIAGSAMVSPLLLWLVRELYIASGGTPALGIVGGTAIRLVLAALVLAIPTLAMGGTLSAATRAIESDGDARRRELAVLYGTNTIGAVMGAMVSTFLLLEVFGTRRTILVAALLNALIALVARSVARKAGEAAAEAPAAVAADVAVAAEASETAAAPAAIAAPVVELAAAHHAGQRTPLAFVLVASGLVGFTFFLMEMTWYRMLGPILGGTVFTFGLILAVALLGIGVGGLAYALRPAAKAATILGLALTCVVEAVGLAVAYALGDRIAFAASAARSASVFGFLGQVGAWAMICAVVILPAATASGVQFPLLVNLVGRGRVEVGRHLGMVYAANTAGAIAGALLGGFALLPWLGATRCWQLAVVLLVIVAAAALAFGARTTPWRARVPVGVLGALAVVLLLADGPTAVWRHSGIGAGRARDLRTPASAQNFANHTRRSLKWESEGVESSVALIGQIGLAFVVNGKVDGNAQIDAATQMMGGLVGAVIHPDPKRALVVGLGTGETAGWLADAPGVERVDAIELEPAILEVARWCAPLNRNVLANPKVHVRIGDAREHLLVGDGRYDLVFSEPSNPYRAGVSSLYTREFYQAVRDRLGDDGLFMQWTQSYEIDGETIATIYGTLADVFPEVHTWRLQTADLLFIASKSPIRYSAAQIAERASTPVVRAALDYAWHTEGLEGFLSHFVGGTALANEIAKRAPGLNTDDHTLIEFAFARSLGQTGLQNFTPLRDIAGELRTDRPEVVGAIDWGRFDEQRALADAVDRNKVAIQRVALPADVRARAEARLAYASGNPAAALAAWKRQGAAPASHFDLLLVGESLAAAGDDAALPHIETLRAAHPTEADLITARLRASQRRFDDAAAALVAGLVRLRDDAFVDNGLATRTLQVALDLAKASRPHTARMFETVAQPFALYLAEDNRLGTMLAIAELIDDRAVATALAPIEPDVPFTFSVLARRAAAYTALDHPLASRARDDLDAFVAGQPRAVMPGTVGEDAEPDAPATPHDD